MLKSSSHTGNPKNLIFNAKRDKLKIARKSSTNLMKGPEKLPLLLNRQLARRLEEGEEPQFAGFCYLATGKV